MSFFFLFLFLQNEANDCYSDRQAALEEVKHGAQGMYVPECTPDNKYQRVQCHKSAGSLSFHLFKVSFIFLENLSTFCLLHFRLLLVRQ